MRASLRKLPYSKTNCVRRQPQPIFTTLRAASCLRGLRCSSPTHREDHLSLVDVGVNHHMVAMLDLAFQDLQRQRVLDQPLDGALQRASAIRAVIAFDK